MRLQNMSAAGMVQFPDAGVQNPNLVTLDSFFREVRYEKGSIIYRPLDASNRLCLVRSGRVRLLRIGRHRARSVVDLLGPGDLFGGVLGPEGPSDEMALAASDVTVWTIEEHALGVLLESRPALAVQLLEGMGQRVRQLQRRLRALTFKEVPGRLADTLLMLGETHGEPCPHGGEVDLDCATQQDLADLVGASRSFVSTLINEMKRDGSLANVGRTLCLKDRKALRRHAARE
jgi:CRP/FNR family transcriptional regulator, cyclic AMP receptor protein